MSEITLTRDLVPLTEEEQLAKGRELYERLARTCHGYPMNVALGAMFMLIHACYESAPEEIKESLLAGIVNSYHQIIGGSNAAPH